MSFKNGSDYDIHDLRTLGPTKKTRVAISEKLKGHKQSADTRDKRAKSMTGKKHTDETRAKISASHKGREFSDETRAKMSASHKGKTYSDEYIQKQRYAHAKWLYITPKGEFINAMDAAIANGMSRDSLCYNTRYEKKDGFSRKKLDK